MQTLKKRPEMLLFFVMIAAAALGNGLSDSVYSNYFKEVFHVNATQRAFIEFPRELPGLLCALIIASMSMLGDLKASLIAQVLACVGLTALGLFTPSFSVMLIFLFINSLGMHLFMPLSDGIGMSLAEPGQVGRRMGQYASVKMGAGFAAGLLVFFGFRLEWFSFQTPVNLLFLIGAGAFVVAILAALLLVRREGQVSPVKRQRVKLVFRKQYRWYYLLTMLHGVQKQIAYVFGAWVIVDLLQKGADVMSLLLIASSFISIFFMRVIGRWIDRLGIARMLFVNAFAFIFIYLIYGFVVWGITTRLIPDAGWPVIVVYALFVTDRLSMQLGVVKSIYLRQIAVNDEEVTQVLSTGISLDHLVSILAAQFSGLVWTHLGPQWVFFMAAFFSLGNVLAAKKAEQEGRQLAACEGQA